MDNITQFRGKNISKEDVIKELKNFDLEYPNPNQFRNWLEGEKYKYILKFEGRSYPPKHILSKITNIDVSKFSGGDETNNVFKELDFNIENKEIEIRYWKIAPGDNARFWERCIQDGNIAVGWDAGFGDYDLSKLLNDQREFEKIYVEKYKDTRGAQLKREMKQLWNFLQLNRGDVIVANRGMRSIVGIGKVTGGYKYRPEYSEYKHTIQVEWFDVQEKDIPSQAKEIIKNWWSLTLKELSQNDYHLLINKSEDLTMKLNSDPIFSLLNKKKQIILYGPPGTGKTYNTKQITIGVIRND